MILSMVSQCCAIILYFTLTNRNRFTASNLVTPLCHPKCMRHRTNIGTNLFSRLHISLSTTAMLYFIDEISGLRLFSPFEKNDATEITLR